MAGDRVLGHRPRAALGEAGARAWRACSYASGVSTSVSVARPAAAHERVAVERALLRGAVVDRVHHVGPAAERRRRACRRRSPWPSTRGRDARRSARPRRPSAIVAPLFTSSKIEQRAVLVQQVGEALRGSRARGWQMPMFIITGSRIRHAISSPRSSSSADSTSRSLNGTTCVYSAITAGMPVRHRRRGRRLAPAHQVGVRHDREHHRVVVPVVRALDLHDVLATGRGAGDADRAHRRLGAGVAEAHRVAPGSAGTAPRRRATVDSVGAAKCVPVRAARSIASATFGCAWPTTIEPKPLWKSTYSLPSTSQTRLPFPSRR